MTNPLINQFAQLPLQGQLDLSQVGGNVVAARVSNNISAGVTVAAGQAVKLDTTAPATAQDGVPPVLPLASSSEITYGFVKYSIKDASFGANARMELALGETVMYMTADATSIPTTRGQALEYNYSTNTVLPWAGINPIIGFAYDAAVSAGDLIRVWIDPPAFKSQGGIKNVSVTATQTQINAGITLIPAIAGKAINLLNFTSTATGTWATGTAIVLEDTASSPVAAFTLAQANLGSTLFPGQTGVTVGAGFGVPLTSGKGLQAVHTGSNFTGGTNITFNLTYTQQ